MAEVRRAISFALISTAGQERSSRLVRQLAAAEQWSKRSCYLLDEYDPPAPPGPPVLAYMRACGAH